MDSDGDGIERIDALREIDPNGVVDIEWASHAHEHLCYFRVDAPIGVLVGIDLAVPRANATQMPYGKACPAARPTRLRYRAGSRFSPPARTP